MPVPLPAPKSTPAFLKVIWIVPVPAFAKGKAAISMMAAVTAIAPSRIG
jgi:hypothetical protein